MPRYTARLRVPADIGLALQQARLAQGRTQAELGEDLGVSQSTISAIEAGQSTILVRRILEMARETGLEFSASWEVPDASGD